VIIWGVVVFNTTFKNISVISWWSVLLLKETGVPGDNLHCNIPCKYGGVLFGGLAYTTRIPFMAVNRPIKNKIL
jgi:hypothetical protein